MGETQWFEPKGNMLDDKTLIQRAKKGDREAFGAIYDAYADDLLSLAIHLCRNVHLAEDVVQEAFVGLARNLRRLRLRRSLKSYLATGVANRLRDQFRRQRYTERQWNPSVFEPADTAGPPQRVELDEQARLALAALEKLPAEQRQAVQLRVYGDLTFRQIAAVQQVSTKTALSRYRYGLDKIRHHLNGKVNHET